MSTTKPEKVTVRVSALTDVTKMLAVLSSSCRWWAVVIFPLTLVYLCFYKDRRMNRFIIAMGGEGLERAIFKLGAPQAERFPGKFG